MKEFLRLTLILLGLSIGLVNPECVAFIGNGVVVHIPAFFQELDNLVAKGEFLVFTLLLQSAEDLHSND